MLGGGGGEGGKDDVRRIPDTRVSNPSTKVNETCQNPRIWLIFTTLGGLSRPGGPGPLMFGGLTDKTRPISLPQVRRTTWGRGHGGSSLRSACGSIGDEKQPYGGILWFAES